LVKPKVKALIGWQTKELKKLKVPLKPCILVYGIANIDGEDKPTFWCHNCEQYEGELSQNGELCAKFKATNICINKFDKHLKTKLHIKLHTDEIPEEGPIQRGFGISNKLLVNYKTVGYLSAHFITNHHLPISMYKPLMNLHQICQNPHVTPRNTANRNDYGYKRCLSLMDSEALIRISQIQRFSLILDESTDRTKDSVVSFVIRIINPNLHDDSLLILNNVIGCPKLIGKTASHLVDATKTVLSECNLEFSNLVSIATDNCNTMVGVHNGYGRKIERERNSNSELIHVGCYAHKAALCVTNSFSGTKKLKDESERVDMALSIFINAFAWRGDLGDRLIELQKEFIQESEFKVKYGKIPSLAPTRWLNRFQSLDLICNHHVSLRKVLEDENDSPAKNAINNIEYLVRLHFARELLRPMNTFLTKVQKSDLIIFELIELYKHLHFQYEGLSQLDSDLWGKSFGLGNEDITVTTSSVYDDCVIRENSSFSLETIQMTYQEWATEIYNQVNERIPLDDPIWSSFQLLNPKNNLDKNQSDIFMELVEVQFPDLKFNHIEVKDGWRLYVESMNEIMKTFSHSDSYNHIFKHFFLHKRHLFENYPTIMIVLETVLLISPTSVGCESSFSVRNTIKRSERNSLGTDTITKTMRVDNWVPELGWDKARSLSIMDLREVSRVRTDTNQERPRDFEGEPPKKIQRR